MKFFTTLFVDGNNTGIKVPPEVIETLGAGRKPPVAVMLNGSYGYRSTVAVMVSRPRNSWAPLRFCRRCCSSSSKSLSQVSKSKG